MTLVNNFPAPLSDPISRQKRPEYKDTQDPQAGLLTDAWIDYFTAQSLLLSKAGGIAYEASLQQQDASIAATDLTDGTLTTGFYELRYYLSVDQSAGAASKITAAFSWTSHGNAKTFTGPDLTSDLVDQYDAQCIPMWLDAQSPLTYSTTYAAGGPMLYSLEIVLVEMIA